MACFGQQLITKVLFKYLKLFPKQNGSKTAEHLNMAALCLVNYFIWQCSLSAGTSMNASFVLSNLGDFLWKNPLSKSGGALCR
jgi:hypothetical protein